MNRSLYSGVSGLKAHQTKMDVIGNNISNVNTYGFKASRVTFSDVYYQTVSGGSSGSSTSGGTNSSAIGYGTSVGSIDLLMGQSSFTMTDSTMDLAIDGEGFLQVQDADGNTYYTRAGALTFDSAGNLVDSQGNFVLGINGDPLGQSSKGTSLIQLSLPSVTANKPSGSETINNIEYTISASNATAAGNIAMQIVQGSNMTDGVKAVAEVGTNGMVITLNPTEEFASMDELNTAINEAIETYMQEHTGASHPAGTFTINMNPSDSGTWPRTGEEICSTDYALQSGVIDGWPTTTVGGGFSPNGTTGSGYSADGEMTAFDITYNDDGSFTVEAIIAGETYKANIDASKTEAGTMKLINGTNQDDYIVFKRPSYTAIESAMKTANKDDTGIVNDDKLVANGKWVALGADAGPITSTKATASNCLGLSGNKFVLSGGTEGGAQGVESLTGIAVGADGTIVATHAQLGEVVVGRICVATFANPEGLVQSSGTYFTEGENSGEKNVCTPGIDGSGKLVSGSLELSNVDLSREFSDMITTQRGYQACSRLITVSDEMLEELVNLKR